MSKYRSTHAHTHSLTHTHSHTHTHAHTLPYTKINTLTLTLTHLHKHTCIHTLSLTHKTHTHIPCCRARVGTMAWGSHVLSSGSRDRTILQRDVRAPEHFSAKLQSHRSEVCGLKVCVRARACVRSFAWHPELNAISMHSILFCFSMYGVHASSL